jgi:hypothetical protein
MNTGGAELSSTCSKEPTQFKPQLEAEPPSRYNSHSGQPSADSQKQEQGEMTNEFGVLLI